MGSGIFDVDYDSNFYIDIDIDVDVDLDIDLDIDINIDKGFANSLPIDIESKQLLLID